MNGPMTPERARELLEAQIEELNALRNAHARDPRFKQWRQATLTLIQRIWPGDAARAERFRRVPFSPPSSKMTAKATRSFFEKGCAEAIQLVRSMIPELGRTLNHPSRAGSSAGPAPGEIEDDFPVVDLPGVRPSRPADSDDDAADDTTDISTTPAPPTSAKHEPRRPTPPGTRARDEEPVHEPPKPTAGKVSMRTGSQPADARPPLREMLGFSSRPLDDEEPDAAPLAEADEITAYDDGREAEPVPGEWQVDEMADDSDIAAEAEGWEAPQEFQLPARSGRFRDEDVDPIIEIEPENFPAAEPEPEAEPEESEFEPPNDEEPVEPGEDDDTDVMAEFLRTSPVLKASARPVRKRGSDAPATRSAAAVSLVALASEVAQLGVPDGQRAGMRATLIELANRVDERSLDWDTLRESFQAVLDYPALARRVIPLLIPYLDAAA